ncbi:hypothetical protein COV94_00630, partial [Candidatus Woesearchaeota archaeon CG11_big_fil_rev_8_21_14_0_20_57_5]
LRIGDREYNGGIAVYPFSMGHFPMEAVSSQVDPLFMTVVRTEGDTAYHELLYPAPIARPRLADPEGQIVALHRSVAQYLSEHGAELTSPRTEQGGTHFGPVRYKQYDVVSCRSPLDVAFLRDRPA